MNSRLYKEIANNPALRKNFIVPALAMAAIYAMFYLGAQYFLSFRFMSDEFNTYRPYWPQIDMLPPRPSAVAEYLHSRDYLLLLAYWSILKFGPFLLIPMILTVALSLSRMRATQTRMRTAFLVAFAIFAGFIGVLAFDSAPRRKYHDFQFEFTVFATLGFPYAVFIQSILLHWIYSTVTSSAFSISAAADFVISRFGRLLLINLIAAVLLVLPIALLDRYSFPISRTPVQPLLPDIIFCFQIFAAFAALLVLFSIHGRLSIGFSSLGPFILWTTATLIALVLLAAFNAQVFPSFHEMPLHWQIGLAFISTACKFCILFVFLGSFVYIFAERTGRHVA